MMTSTSQFQMSPDRSPPEKRKKKNPWGAGGTRKCRECRRAKQACHYRDGNENLSCDRCHRKGLPCGKKELAPGRLEPGGHFQTSTQPSLQEGPNTSALPFLPSTQDSRISFLESVGVTLSQELHQQPLPLGLQGVSLSTIVLGLESEPSRRGATPLQIFGLTRDYLLAAMRRPTPQPAAVQPTPVDPPMSIPGNMSMSSMSFNRYDVDDDMFGNNREYHVNAFPQNSMATRSNDPPSGYIQRSRTEDQFNFENFVTPRIPNRNDPAHIPAWHSSVGETPATPRLDTITKISMGSPNEREDDDERQDDDD